MIAKILLSLSLALPLAGYGVNAGSRCESLAEKTLAAATITGAEQLPAGSFAAPDGRSMQNLPAFCRVSATLRPTPTSNIKIELWMPESGWNGRLLGTGNGGGAGRIDYGGLATGLRRGFATVNTDMGTSPDANQVVEYPARWADFGYRSTHEMTVAAKTLLDEFYDRHQARSYFMGCSTGGQQALMESQRYPADYDGILAGAPANNRTNMTADFLWNYRASQATPTSALPKEKIALITRAVVAACAGRDGGSPQDNFLTDPRLCRFNPDTIPLCHGVAASDCLSPEQMTALKQMEAGPTNPRTGERIYAPFPVGSESSPLGLDYQQDPKRLPGEQFYVFRWAFGNTFDFRRFDFDKDIDTLNRKLGPLLNANSPDLSAFQKRGGKLVMYTGTADPLVEYPDALNYYERVIRADAKHAGRKENIAETEQYFRYFLVPGMGHCGSGPGLNSMFGSTAAGVPEDPAHDVLAALVAWVEQGKAPNTTVATGFVDGSAAKGVRLQRPVCLYPKFPQYAGGDWKRPESYRCVEHGRGAVPIPAPSTLH